MNDTLIRTLIQLIHFFQIFTIFKYVEGLIEVISTQEIDFGVKTLSSPPTKSIPYAAQLRPVTTPTLQI